MLGQPRLECRVHNEKRGSWCSPVALSCGAEMAVKRWRRSGSGQRSADDTKQGLVAVPGFEQLRPSMSRRWRLRLHGGTVLGAAVWLHRSAARSTHGRTTTKTHGSGFLPTSCATSSSFSSPLPLLPPQAAAVDVDAEYPRAATGQGGQLGIGFIGWRGLGFEGRQVVEMRCGSTWLPLAVASAVEAASMDVLTAVKHQIYDRQPLHSCIMIVHL
jgi:hypothetical protein